MGAAYTITGAVALGGGYGGVAGILLSPVGAVVGSVVGAFTADPAAIVVQREETARQILTNRALQEALRDRLAAAGRVQTGGKFVVLADDRGPAARDTQVGYAALAQEGIGTVLEVRVDNVHLEGGGIDPPLALRMTARTRIVRTAGDLELYASSLTYSGGEQHTLEEWVARDGELLRRELERADAILAEKIVDEVFLLVLFPARSGDK